MSLTNVFASALRYYRERTKLSQDELSVRAGLDRTYISQLERGLKSPTLTTIQSIAAVLGLDPQMLVRTLPPKPSPRCPTDYHINTAARVSLRRATRSAQVSPDLLFAGINATHDLIDSVYSSDVDIARVLGMRNLSSFLGELLASAIVKSSNGAFRGNPHQDGYPDLLLMDEVGNAAWEALRDRLNHKQPFSPFSGGGLEINATCGSIPTPAVFLRRALTRPDLGDTRLPSLTGYDWKAHHRDTNNLVGVLWDFIDSRPRIVALFYSNDLVEEDWGRIVQPREGGGRTTSVSIMGRTGIRKMYDGWLCVLASQGYAKFLNTRNEGSHIPEE